MIKIYDFLILIIGTVLNSKYNFFYFPCNKEMMDYQFNFFTTITVLAGFSFTALGILLSLNSEYVISKLKNTLIVSSLYLNLLKSICFLICSSIISLTFIWNIFLNSKIRKVLYSVECFLVILGIIYFLIAIFIMAKIIKKMFPKNKIQRDKNKKEFNRQQEQARERRSKMEDKYEDNEW